MVWLEMIGENSGAFYLDVYAFELSPRSDRFFCSMSGILGDGNWESPVLVELGQDVSVTFLQDSWDGLRASDDIPPIDIGQLGAAIRNALDCHTGFSGHPLSGIGFKSPHPVCPKGTSAGAYALVEKSSSPMVCEDSGYAKTAA